MRHTFRIECTCSYNRTSVSFFRTSWISGSTVSVKTSLQNYGCYTCIHCLCSYRSPGGTVKGCRRRSLEVGEGPTPMLTRALRKKFQVSLIIQGTLFFESVTICFGGIKLSILKCVFLLFSLQTAYPLSPIQSLTPSPNISPLPPSPPPPSELAPEHVEKIEDPPSPPPNSLLTSQTSSPNSILEIREV